MLSGPVKITVASGLAAAMADAPCPQLSSSEKKKSGLCRQRMTSSFGLNLSKSTPVTAIVIDDEPYPSLDSSSHGGSVNAAPDSPVIGARRPSPPSAAAPSASSSSSSSASSAVPKTQLQQQYQQMVSPKEVRSNVVNLDDDDDVVDLAEPRASNSQSAMERAISNTSITSRSASSLTITYTTEATSAASESAQHEGSGEGGSAPDSPSIHIRRKRLRTPADTVSSSHPQQTKPRLSQSPHSSPSASSPSPAPPPAAPAASSSTSSSAHSAANPSIATRSRTGAASKQPTINFPAAGTRSHSATSSSTAHAAAVAAASFKPTHAGHGFQDVLDMSQRYANEAPVYHCEPLQLNRRSQLPSSPPLPSSEHELTQNRHTSKGHRRIRTREQLNQFQWGLPRVSVSQFLLASRRGFGYSHLFILVIHSRC